ncbi:MAG: 3'-5' exonuclease [Aquificota bacterium]|nr:3'-5' exonuclease [Aquificota bacterium]
MGKATFTVFDTETTGLDPKKSELISIGALKVREMSLKLSSTLHRFILPAELSRSSVEVHGITLEELREKAEPLERGFQKTSLTSRREAYLLALTLSLTEG